jgi:hypothetical protein
MWSLLAPAGLGGVPVPCPSAVPSGVTGNRQPALACRHLPVLIGVIQGLRLPACCCVRRVPVHIPCAAPELSAKRGDEVARASDVAPVKIRVAADEPLSVLWPPEIGWLREVAVGALDLRCSGNRASDQVVATVRQVERREPAQRRSDGLVLSNVVLPKTLTFTLEFTTLLVISRLGGEPGHRCIEAVALPDREPTVIWRGGVLGESRDELLEEPAHANPPEGLFTAVVEEQVSLVAPRYEPADGPETSQRGGDPQRGRRIRRNADGRTECHTSRFADRSERCTPLISRARFVG